MNRKAYILITMIVVLVALVALSANTALAGREIDKLPVEHAPVCYRVESFAPGILELQCFDVGKDIINVGVKTNSKYELNWNSDSVTLRVYPIEKGAVALWAVQDKAGNVTSGRLQ